MRRYDVIWIGTGQATGTVIPKLAAAGKRVAIAEGGRVGGSCVNYGCTPTKTLVASARAAHMVRRAADFGVDVTDFAIDFDKVMARQNAIRNRSSQGLKEWLQGMEGVDFYAEYASFVDPHTVRMGEETVQGDTIVIHTGAKPRVPEIPGLEQVPWLDNARLLDLKILPEHLVVIGGSYIGLEFGQAFRRFGSRVTVLEGSPQLMFREDEDVAAGALEILRKEGVEVELGARVERVTSTDDGVKVLFAQDGGTHSVTGSHLLVATGRVPNTAMLNLDAAGVECTERGYVPANDVMQTNVPHIFAVGDVNGAGAFTHTSVNDGQIFWDFYSGEGDRLRSDRNTVYAMYIDPPLGRVGMGEKEARKSGRNILMATLPMARVARAREKDETAGLIKLLVDADSKEIVGATVFGVGGDEIINMFAVFMQTGQPYTTFQRAVLTHPTVAELMPWVLDNLKPLN